MAIPLPTPGQLPGQSPMQFPRRFPRQSPEQASTSQGAFGALQRRGQFGQQTGTTQQGLTQQTTAPNWQTTNLAPGGTSFAGAMGLMRTQRGGVGGYDPTKLAQGLEQAGDQKAGVEPSQLNETDMLYNQLMQQQEKGWADTQALMEAQGAAMQRRAMAMQGAMGSAVAGGFAGALGGAFAQGQQMMLGARSQYEQARGALMERIAAEKTRRSEREENISMEQISAMSPEELANAYAKGNISEDQYRAYTGSKQTDPQRAYREDTFSAQQSADWTSTVLGADDWHELNSGQANALAAQVRDYYVQNGVYPTEAQVRELYERALGTYGQADSGSNRFARADKMLGIKR